ncbi:MAG: sigma-70 family RNA polymerase sigma factor, partial [Desulfobulbaceae bacterium]|nr:sigma-70 family RNA polymerase sigma factor [Candidatus Desulfobia pelagia]
MSKKNEAPAPEKWVDLYGDTLFRYAYGQTLNRDLAEDLVQETFLAALRSKSSFEGISSLKTWLIAILKNKTIDHFRRVAFEQPAAGFPDSSDPIIDLFDKQGKWLAEPPRWEEDPQKIVENGQFWHTIQNCIAGFPERLAHIFTLRELNQMTTREITDLMD